MQISFSSICFLQRRKSQRTNLWTSNLESLRKEAYERSSFLGAATKKRGNSSDSAPDPLLSSFIRNSSFTDNKNHRAVNCDAATKGPSCLSAQRYLSPNLLFTMKNIVHVQT